MKNQYLITLFFFFLIASSHAQEFKLIDTVRTEFYYDYNFKVDTTDWTNERYQEMVLQLGSHCSKFASANKIYRDSLIYQVRNLDMESGLNKIWPKINGLSTHLFCKYDLIKDFPKKENTRFIGTLGSKSTIFVDNSIKFNWQLLDSRDTIILNYPCKMAKCKFAGREYTAWYTLEIPIPNGPYKFGGLPGLILSVNDSKKEHSFQLYKIKNYSTIKPIYCIYGKNYKTATAPQFTKALKAYTVEMYKRFGGNSSPIQYQNPEQESRTLRNIRSWNNYIEKY